MIRRNFITALLGTLGLAASATPKASVSEGKLECFTSELKSPRTAKLRVWTLGSLEHRILPTQKAIDLLQDKLSGWDGQSDIDLIWGPDLKVQQLDLDAPQGMDVIVPADHKLEVEQVERDANGNLTARLILKEPMVRIINREVKP